MVKTLPGYNILLVGAFFGIPMVLMKLGDWLLWGWLLRMEAMLHPDWPNNWISISWGIGFILWFWAAQRAGQEILDSEAESKPLPLS